jgi:RNA polymerase sigma factor (sigma-70 family)
MRQPDSVLRHLHRAALLETRGGLTDGELLECFVARRDEAAFEALMRRHGPMVLGVCRRVLQNEADAEDAFQATFLVLVRKAVSVVPRALVGNWLYGVAHTTALKAKVMNRKRREKESEAAAMPRPETPNEFWPLLQAALDEELSRLPDKYRVPIVLCELEGRPVKEAARQLGCPQGTVASRLSRGRALLTRRLARHGLTFAGAVLSAVLAQGAASACVPAPVMTATLKAASFVAASEAAAAGVISARVAVLAEGVIKAMLLRKLKVAAIVLLTATLTVLGMGFVAHLVSAKTAPAWEEPARAKGADDKPAARAADKVTHTFLAIGDETYLVDEKGKVVWTYHHPSRDGWVLDNGNILLALAKSKEFPAGAVVEVTWTGRVVFEFKGTQSEVNTVQPLANGNILLTEAGAKPRLLEVDRKGKIVVEAKLAVQTRDHHLQTGTARKLANGDYLVPQLLDRCVREYDAEGRIKWEFRTPHMPCTAIRLDNGNTLIGCTEGNLVIEIDRRGKEVWRLSNDDLKDKPLNVVCGVQRLPNGNTVITSHRARANEVKMLEVAPDKTIVWTYTDARKSGIHHFHILETNGKVLEGKPFR